LEPDKKYWFRLFDLEIVRKLMDWKQADLTPKLLKFYQTETMKNTPTREFVSTFRPDMLMTYQIQGVEQHRRQEISSLLMTWAGKDSSDFENSRGVGCRTLVICPSTLVDEWGSQIKKFTESETVLIKGSWPVRAKLWEVWKSCHPVHYVVMSWDSLRIRRIWLLLRITAGMASSSLMRITKGKNAQAQRSKAAASLKARRVLGITGSPIENNLKELWHILRLVRPELFTNYERFANTFMILEEKHFGGYNFKDIVGYKNLDVLKQIIAPYYIRRLRTEVLQLPPSSTVVRRVDLSDQQQEIEQLLLKASQEAFNMDRMELVLKYFTYGMENFISPCLLPQGWTPDENLLQEEQLLKLIQEASKDPTPRESEVLEILKESSPNKIIVFSGFKKALERLAGFVQEPISWLTSGVDVQAELATWKGEGSRLLFMTSAGAMGHNLQEQCSMMVVLSSLHNPRMMDQLLARISRMGQKKPVTYYVLDSDSQIEQKLHVNTAEKNELSENVFRNTDLAKMVMCQ
jgi:non-specific serine/threonine protein kinase